MTSDIIDVDQRPVAARSPTDGLVRVLDLLISVSLLILVAPAMVALAVAVRLDSRGPALYRAARLGLGGRPITVYKFRSMYADSDDQAHRDFLLDLLHDDSARPTSGDTMFKLVGDTRVTRVGRWMRRTALDELPQLINVALGEMSLVGPRPEVPYAIEAYEPWHFERFSVKPGMTGLWQVSGRGELPPRQMLALDVEYASTRSLTGDVRILARTVPALLRRQGAN